MENQINGWNNIVVSQFQEIYSLNRNDFNSDDEFNLQLISILIDKPVNDLGDFEYDEYLSTIESIEFIKNLPKNQPKQSIVTPSSILYLKNDFNQLVIGEFIDLENLFTSGYIKNLDIILPILYRVKKIKNSPLYLDEFEKYGDWIFHRAKLFHNIKITDVYGVINMYLKFRDSIFENYSGLFNGEDSSEEEKIDENESIISRSEKKKEKDRNDSVRKWSWDIFLLRLAQNDATKIDQVTQMNLLQALNVLSMKKELQIPD